MSIAIQRQGDQERPQTDMAPSNKFASNIVRAVKKSMCS